MDTLRKPQWRKMKTSALTRVPLCVMSKFVYKIVISMEKIAIEIFRYEITIKNR